MSQFDATARINVDMSGFARAASQSTSAGGAFTASIRSLQTAMTNFEGVDKRTATRLQNELNLYKTLSSTVASYANAITKLGSINTQTATNQKRLNTAMEAMGNVLSKVTGLTAKEAEAKARELRLYQQLATAVSTYANALVKMASLQQRSVDAANKAAQAEQRLANQREKLANETVKLAQQQQRLDQQAQSLILKQQALQQATANTNRAMQQTSSGMGNLSSSSFALRNTLGELESTFSGLLKIISAVPTAMAQAAISQEAAFAQVTRVVGKTEAAAAGLLERFQDIAQTAPISFEEVARIGQLGAQIGITASELGDFTDTIVKFSITTGVSADEAAILLGRIAEMQNVPITEMENLGSAILALGTASAATDQEIIRVNESIATVSNIFGLTTQATAGLSAALATLRVRPELARGSLTRVFGELRDAVEGGGDQLTRLSKVMGLTNVEVVKLFQSSPDEFFKKFIKGLSDGAANGESFRGVLAELGIRAVRDVDTISRLGNNYDVLANSIDTAFVEYAKGTELQRQSKGIYETTKNEVQNLVDTFSNFLATAGGPLAKAVGILASALSGVVGFITDLGPIVPLLGAIVATVAVGAAGWAAYQVVLAKTITNIIAMRELQKNLGVTTLGLTTAISTWRNTTASAATSSAAAGRAMQGQTVAAQQLSAAMSATGVSSSRVVVANASLSTSTAQVATGFKAQSTAMTQAANSAAAFAVSGGRVAVTNEAIAVTGAQAAAGSRAMGSALALTGSSANVAAVGLTAVGAGATRASLGMRALTLATGPWGIALSAVALVLGPLLFDMDLWTSKADKMADAAFEAAGGQQALGKAIEADTKAAKTGGTVFREITSTYDDFDDAARKNLETTKKSAEARIREITLLNGSVEKLREQAKGSDSAGAAARRYLQEIEAAGKTVDKTNEALTESVQVFGNQAAAMRRTAVEALITESAIGKNSKAFDRLKETGIDVGEVLKRSFSDPKGATEELDAAIKSLNREVHLVTQSKGIDPAMAKSLGQTRDAAQGAQDFLKAFKEEIKKTGDEAVNGARVMELLGAAEDSLGAKTEAVGGAVKLTKENLEDLDTTAEEAQESIDELAKSMEGFGTFATAFEAAATKASGGVKSSTDDAAKAVDNFSLKTKKGFEAYLTELESIAKAQRDWAVNLIKISATLGPEIAAKFREAGPDAAKAVSEIANLSTEELAKLKPRLEATMGDNVAGLSAAILKSQIPITNATASTAKAVNETFVRELNSAKTAAEIQAVVDKYGNIIAGIKNSKGEVNIDTTKAFSNLGELDRYLKAKEAIKGWDVNAVAQMDDSPFKTHLLEMFKLVQSYENTNKLDPDGQADVETNTFHNKVREMQNSVSRGEANKAFSPDGQANVETTRFNNDLSRIEGSSSRTGSRVRDNLSVHANAFLSVASNIKKILGFADGGWIQGRGGPREDNIPVAASAGEFIVNAKSARKYGPLLEQLNNDNGGAVGPQRAPGVQGTNPATASVPSLGIRASSAHAKEARAPQQALALTQQAVGRQGPSTVINVTNYYPVAEATSKTVNRVLAHAAYLDGTS